MQSSLISSLAGGASFKSGMIFEGLHHFIQLLLSQMALVLACSRLPLASRSIMLVRSSTFCLGSIARIMQYRFDIHPVYL